MRTWIVTSSVFFLAMSSLASAQTPKVVIDGSGIDMDLLVPGEGVGIVFPDGTTQTTAATGGGETVPGHGGTNNTVGGTDAFIGGGYGNTTSAINAAISGGKNNSVSGLFGTTGGGFGNVNSGSYGAISGGFTNQATAFAGAVGGGKNNVASGSQSTVAGGLGNTAVGTNAAVGGGYGNVAGNVLTPSLSAATVGGGGNNEATTFAATVAGGHANDAIAYSATVGGGGNNHANGYASTIAGGNFNQADVSYGAVGGGSGNTAGGFSSTVPGGYGNIAASDFSFAAGRRCRIDAAHDGAFMFADQTNANFDSAAANEFAVRANGGVRFITNSGTGAGAGLDAGDTTWNVLSAKEAKENYTDIDTINILERVANLPIQRWNYIHQGSGIQHIGPYAKDFYDAFQLHGEYKGTISSQDLDGVALAAIQGLNRKLERELAAKNDEIATMKAELDSMRAAIEALSQR